MNRIKLGPDLYWDKERKILTTHTIAITLSNSLKACLEYLIKRRGYPAQSQDIFNYVWKEYEKDFSSKSVRSLISELRKKVPALKITNYYGGLYALEKYRELIPDIQEYFFDILDQAKNGITITDPNQEDNPVIYTNEAFVDTFGYSVEEVLGRNPRYLQNEDTEQDVLKDIREAIRNRVAITALLRNYHKNGTLVYNEVTISPIFDKKTLELKYFLGIQRDITSLYTLMKKVESEDANAAYPKPKY
ncbi:MAG: PAS domain S-box protein [Sulfurimonas sp.]|nr:PAS domain S-box protein [Sulfurimonas sp.]